ncbi:hypothetical protein GCM10011367_01440 [Marinicauda pacifica]|jgi:hypothetical protein|uniref:DUF1476 domain-containing protein n=1 Tax=Marinicauda pacifica TaxID=1133559 RepID=A0A4S2HFL6_9PROT|nr:DUF1476 domain-containing protein [Marinicauda pacifica]GGE30813.1 hypothetical protein GCM10011367_01440 [Marinicauda pacifica]
MPNFNDREKAFENKYVHDQDLEFKAQVRRNRLLAAWAGELMGLSADEIDAYKKELVKVDFEEPGDEDVFRKVRADFDAKNVDQSDHQLRRTMDELMAEAREQVRSEG